MTGDVPQSEVDQFHRGVTVGKVSPVLGDFTELEVDGLDRVGRVHDLAQLGGIVQEGDELVPGVAPHLDRARVSGTELLVEIVQGDLGGFEGGGGVNRPHPGGDLLAVLVRHESHSVFR